MNGELVLIESGSEMEPRGGANWERFVETDRKSHAEGSVIGGRRGGGEPQEVDCYVRVDFGRRGEGESTI